MKTEILISGMAITSTGVKKGELLVADVGTKVVNKNITVDFKVDTNSNLLSTITIDESAPGLKAIISFKAPEQKSGKDELQYLNEYAGINTSIGLTGNPIVNFSGVIGNNTVALGTDLLFDTASGNFTKCNLGLNYINVDLIASLNVISLMLMENDVMMNISLCDWNIWSCQHCLAREPDVSINVFGADIPGNMEVDDAIISPGITGVISGSTGLDSSGLSYNNE